ncbi:hypothetical protein J6590_089550 [Homalodisca vitripennis]|nr:hypothetical protein J6590_089550 [Homalodisca vitripennis]
MSGLILILRVRRIMGGITEPISHGRWTLHLRFKNGLINYFCLEEQEMAISFRPFVVSTVGGNFYIPPSSRKFPKLKSSMVDI